MLAAQIVIKTLVLLLIISVIGAVLTWIQYCLPALVCRG